MSGQTSWLLQFGRLVLTWYLLEGTPHTHGWRRSERSADVATVGSASASASFSYFNGI